MDWGEVRAEAGMDWERSVQRQGWTRRGQCRDRDGLGEVSAETGMD